MLCKYCQQPAKYAPKTKYGNWCCSERFYDCPGYRAHLREKSNPWNKGKTGVQEAWNKGKPGTFKGRHHTEETKTKISSSMNGNTNANHRGDRQSYYGETRMDSRWEVGTAAYFDRNGICWKYNERGYKLSNGRYYYPDFFIYSGDKLVKLVEVKGYFREANRLKFELFKECYPDITIELWDRKVLFDNGIINSSGYIGVVDR